MNRVMTKEEFEAACEAVIVDFDFNRVVKVTDALSWKWLGEPVTVEKAKATARRLLLGLYGMPPGASISTGGFQAIIDKGCLALVFKAVASSYDVGYEGDDGAEMPVWDGSGEAPSPDLLTPLRALQGQ